jgi:hypothetical protein
MKDDELIAKKTEFYYWQRELVVTLSIIKESDCCAALLLLLVLLMMMAKTGERLFVECPRESAQFLLRARATRAAAGTALCFGFVRPLRPTTAKPWTPCFSCRCSGSTP